MKEILEDFVSNEKRKVKWQIGRINASSLSGFIAGIIVTTAFFLAIFDLSSKL